MSTSTPAPSTTSVQLLHFSPYCLQLVKAQMVLATCAPQAAGPPEARCSPASPVVRLSAFLVALSVSLLSLSTQCNYTRQNVQAPRAFVTCHCPLFLPHSSCCNIRLWLHIPRRCHVCSRLPPNQRVPSWHGGSQVAQGPSNPRRLCVQAWARFGGWHRCEGLEVKCRLGIV